MKVVAVALAAALAFALGCATNTNTGVERNAGKSNESARSRCVEAAVRYASTTLKPELLAQVQTEDCLLVKFGGGLSGGGADVLVSLETGMFLRSSYVPEATK